MWTHRRRLGVIAQATWPPAGNGLAGGAGAAAGPLPQAADRPCSQPPGHIPRRSRAASRHPMLLWCQAAASEVRCDHAVASL
jgi:hypothetical protein